MCEQSPYLRNLNSMILRLVLPIFSSQYFPPPPFRLIFQDLLGGKYSLICHFLLSFFILLFSFVRDLIIAEFCAFSCHLNQNSKCVKLRMSFSLYGQEVRARVSPVVQVCRKWGFGESGAKFEDGNRSEQSLVGTVLNDHCPSSCQVIRCILQSCHCSAWGIEPLHRAVSGHMATEWKMWVSNMVCSTQRSWRASST